MAEHNLNGKLAGITTVKSKEHETLGASVPKPSRVLVTGGAGFIGANLIRLLLGQGHQVRVLDNLVAGRREYLDGLPVEFMYGDILDRALVERAVSNRDGVVHLAAQTGVPGSLLDPEKDCEVNVSGTLNLLEACRAERICPRFIFASSNAPLGRQAPPASEDKAPLPISPYGASKLAGEAYCLAYHGSWGIGAVVLRFGNVYGPFSEHKGSVVAKFVKDISARGKLVVDGDGQQTRDFIYVDDLCRAILLALESNVCGEVFQVATGTETTVAEIAEMVKLAGNVNAVVTNGPPRQADVRRNYSAIDKIRRTLAWEPRVDLATGLQLTMEWFHDYSKAGSMTMAAARPPKA